MSSFTSSLFSWIQDNPILSLVLLISLTLTSRYTFKRNIRLPPGPKPLPFIGNAHQIQDKPLPDALLDWHRQYGPIISYRLGSQLVISLSSHQICTDLLSKRGPIYSSRPDLVIARHATNGLNMALMPAGKQLDTHRRLITPFMTTTMSNEYRMVQDVESKQMLHDFLANNDFTYHIMRYTASLGYALQYGRRLGQDDSFEIWETSAIVKELTHALSEKNNAIVELFPILDYLPTFLAPWKQFGKKAYNRAVAFYRRNLEIGQSSSSWNWTRQMTQLPAAQQIPSTDLSFLLGLTMQAGVETTASALRVFIRAALFHPQSVEKVQKELDEAVGVDRMPNFEDASRLPYLNAFVSEVLRWQSIAPITIPHATTQDDEYMGYTIPKGTTIVPNAWAMAFDPETYPDPYTFKPERWLGSPEQYATVFGYGRRICPGKQMAMNSMFIILTRVMWGYHIKPVYKDGKKVEYDPWDIVHSFTSGPGDFEAEFEVRSALHKETIEREWEGAEKDSSVLLEKLRKT